MTKFQSRSKLFRLLKVVIFSCTKIFTFVLNTILRQSLLTTCNLHEIIKLNHFLTRYTLLLEEMDHLFF